MKPELIIRILPGEHQFTKKKFSLDFSSMPIQWTHKPFIINSLKDIHTGKIENLKQWIDTNINSQQDELSTVILLPGTIAGWSNISLTPAQKKHLNQVVAYLIEDKIIENIDSLHFIHGKLNNDDSLRVAYISIVIIEQLINTLEKLNISLDFIIHELSLWPDASDNVMLAFENDFVTLSSNQHLAQTFEIAALSSVLPTYLSAEPTSTDVQESVVLLHEEQEETTQNPDYIKTQSINLIVNREKHEINVQQIADISGSDTKIIENDNNTNREIFEILLNHLEAKTTKQQLLNFRSGKYANSKKNNKQWLKWRPLLTVLTCWFVIEIGLFSIQSIWYKSLANSLADKNIATYRSLNPADKTVLDVRSRFNQLIKKHSIDKNINDFMPVFNKISAATAKFDRETVRAISIDYNGKQHITLKVISKSFDAVNQYIELMKDNNLLVKTDYSDQQKDIVYAQLSIKL